MYTGLYKYIIYKRMILRRKLMSDNLRYYEASRSVPKAAQKAFSNGRFSGTDINPMWRIKMLTELFGPAGIGWYTEIISERAEKISEDTTFAIVDLNLYIRVDGEWSKPIFGTGGNQLVQKGRPSDEGYKMAYTDALSVACKALGIGADVYWDKDPTKYTSAGDKPLPDKSGAVKPPVVTAIDDDTPPWEENPSGEISQNVLTAIGMRYLAGCDSAMKRAAADSIKKIKGGDANYKVVESPDARRKLYDFFWAGLNKKESA